MLKGIVRTLGTGFTLSIEGKGKSFNSADEVIDYVNNEDVVVMNREVFKVKYRNMLKYKLKKVYVRPIELEGDSHSGLYEIYKEDGEIIGTGNIQDITKRCNAYAMEIVNKDILTPNFKKDLVL